MRISILIAGLFALTFFNTSCKKNSSTAKPNTDDIVYASYSKMAPGNYWIYNLYKLDSNYQVASVQTGTDSIYVDKDTVIRGNTFHKYWQPKTVGGQDYFFTYLRDSLQYIVDDKSNIYFASQDFHSVFDTIYQTDPNHAISRVDTPAVILVRMTDKDSTETTPAGKFVTSTLEWDYDLNQYFWLYGPSVRRCSTRYSAGVGMVSQVPPATYSYSPTYSQRKLLRYHVQ